MMTGVGGQNLEGATQNLEEEVMAGVVEGHLEGTVLELVRHCLWGGMHLYVV